MHNEQYTKWINEGEIILDGLMVAGPYLTQTHVKSREEFGKFLKCSSSSHSFSSCLSSTWFGCRGVFHVPDHYLKEPQQCLWRHSDDNAEAQA